MLKDTGFGIEIEVTDGRYLTIRNNEAKEEFVL